MRNTVTIVLGRKGSGKSWLVHELIEGYRPRRVVIIDSLAEYGPESEPKIKAEVARGFDESLDALEAAESRRRFVLSLRVLSPEENLELLGVAFRLRRFLLVVEEASLYCSPTLLPDEVAQLIRYGRHQEIDQVYVARRPSELHRDLTANADVLVTFRQQEPRDLIYLRSFYGREADELPRLPDYHVRAFGEVQRFPDAVLERLAAQKKP